MCTKPLRNGLFCSLILFLHGGHALAQSVEQTESWQADQQIDIELRALLGPVWQPVEFTPADRYSYGVPLFPLYKQEPPGAQGDFSPPPPAPTPTSVPTSPSQPGPKTQPVQPQTPPAPPPPNAQNNLPQQPPPPPPPAPAQGPPCPIVYYDPNCGAGP